MADLYLLGSLDALERAYLAGRAYDYVGLSIRNVDNLAWPGVVSYLPEIREAVARVRRYYPAERVILGGAGYSIFGARLAGALGLPPGVAGAGETALWERLGGAPAAGDEPDFSYHQDAAPEALQRYYRDGGMLGIQSRRGCPFACTYCTYPLLEGRALRLRPPAGVVAELRALREQHGVAVCYFVDCLFNHPRAYTLDLLHALRDARLDVRWYAFASPAGWDAELARAMAQAGCAGVEFGSESGDPLSLRDWGKPYGPESLREASRCCREAGVKFCHYLLLGAPGETPAGIAATVELLRRCEPSTVIVSIGARVYPGTPLEQAGRCQGWLPAGRDLLEPFFLRPEKMDLPEILEWCTRLCPPHWILPGVRDRERAASMARLRQRGAKGPLWDYL